MKKILNNFTPFDLIIIALLSACGIAIKPFVRLLGQALVGSIIPTGAVAGIIYMIWVVLPCNIVKKRGTAVLVGIVQAGLVVVFDMLGNKGIANLLVYIVPCIVLEFGIMPFKNYVSSGFLSFLAGGLANMTGSLIMGVLFFNMPTIPLVISLVTGFISGGIGGVIAFKLFVVFKQWKTADV